MGKVRSLGPHRMSGDPGITGTGLALWGEKDWSRPVPPVALYNLYPRVKGGLKPLYEGEQRWQQKVRVVTEQYVEILELYNVTHFYCELPQYFDSAGGRMVASTGDLTKLISIAGCFSEACRSRDIAVYFYEVNLWKGQLPKSAVNSRILRIIPEILLLDPDDHQWDATGVGLYAKGFFKSGATGYQSGMGRVRQMPYRPRRT